MTPKKGLYPLEAYVQMRTLESTPLRQRLDQLTKQQDQPSSEIDDVLQALIQLHAELLS